MGSPRSSRALRLFRAIGAALTLSGAACGESTSIAPTVDMVRPFTGPIELALLPPSSGVAFTHSAETVVAANGNTVVVAAIQLQFPTTGAWDDRAPYGRRVAVYASDDGGDSFSDAIDPGFGPTTSDPVLWRGAGGRFWLGVLDVTSALTNPLDLALPGFIGSSTDGRRWQTVVSTGANPYWGDRPAMTGDDHSLWIAGDAGFLRYGFDGTLLANQGYGGTEGFAAAFHDAQGAHFARASQPAIDNWDGVSMPVEEARGQAAEFSRLSGGKSLGVARDGRFWLLRGTSDGVVLDRWTPGGSDLVEKVVDGPAAFLPVGALDDDGRLHAAWYQSVGAQGELRYARTATSDLDKGFGSPTVLDDNACPGGSWLPAAEPGDRRRLREYIGLAVDRRRVHVAWTHAPGPPSRVRATHVDF
jgi:hypothetical protein